MVAAGWVGLAPVGVWAQAPGLPGGGMGGYNAVVGKLFHDIPAFTALVDTALTNSEDKSRISVPMRMMKREERIRIEVDFVKLRGSGVDLQGLSALQNIGMARMNSLIVPSEKAMHVLFPEVKFAAKVPMAESELPTANYKVSKKALGKDTVNGQACVRQQVTLTDAAGKRTEATVWEATALNQFPLRIAFKTEDSSVMMTFSQVNLTAPGEDQFSIPAGYRSFESITGLMQEAVTRAFSPSR